MLPTNNANKHPRPPPPHPPRPPHNLFLTPALFSPPPLTRRRQVRRFQADRFRAGVGTRYQSLRAAQLYGAAAAAGAPRHRRRAPLEARRADARARPTAGGGAGLLSGGAARRDVARFFGALPPVGVGERSYVRRHAADERRLRDVRRCAAAAA